MPKTLTVPLHPRNRHQDRYDFGRLVTVCPELSRFLVQNPAGDGTIDFADPQAVRTLNRALLKDQYGIAHWDIPDGYLCPPVPGRADYIHGLADLLAGCNDGGIPRGPAVRVLDVGVGANCIYPLVGHADYGWHFVGSEADATALQAAHAIVLANSGLAHAIELRHQPNRGRIFADVVNRDDRFDLTLCNPPFHASANDAARGSRRKSANLDTPSSTLNFGGTPGELWCTGGEASFVRRMIRESVDIATQVLWFSSLVSKSEHLPDIRKLLAKAGAHEVREVPMAQGNKRSRFVAWTFHDRARQDEWRATRWR